MTASATINVNAAAANHFTVTAPATIPAGTAFSPVVTALDRFNNIATGYTGTVHFSGGGANATLPGNYTFNGADAGRHTFANGATLTALGNQTITATDTVTASIVGSSAAINVTQAIARNWLEQAYFDLTGLAIDSASRTKYTVTLNSFGSNITAGRNAVVSQITTTDAYRAKVISDAITSILNRPATAADMTTWMPFMRAGSTVEMLKANLYGSAEYFALKVPTGTNAQYIAMLYNDILHTTVQNPKILVTTNRVDMAQRILMSPDARTLQAQAYWMTYAHQLPSAQVLAVQIGLLQQNTRGETIIASVMNSAIYVAMTKG